MGKTWADKLLSLGALLAAMSVFTFSRGPAVNEPQRIFRLAVPAVGLLLGLIGLAMKRRHRNKDET